MKTPFKAMMQKTAAEYKKKRQKLGTQEAVAKILGITSRTIIRRENGTEAISTEAQFAIEWAIRSLDAPEKLSVDTRKQKP